jgi:hypothetical protein
MPEETPTPQSQPEWVNNPIPTGSPTQGGLSLPAHVQTDIMDAISQQMIRMSEQIQIVPPRPLRGRTSIASVLDDMDYAGTTPAIEIKEESRSISFHIKNETVLKLTPDGFFVRNILIVKDVEVYNAFIEWLNAVRTQKDLPKIETKSEEPATKSTFNRYTALLKKPGEQS